MLYHHRLTLASLAELPCRRLLVMLLLNVDAASDGLVG